MTQPYRPPGATCNARTADMPGFRCIPRPKPRSRRWTRCSAQPRRPCKDAPPAPVHEPEPVAAVIDGPDACNPGVESAAEQSAPRCRARHQARRGRRAVQANPPLPGAAHAGREPSCDPARGSGARNRRAPAEAPGMPEVQPELGLPEAAPEPMAEAAPAMDPGPVETGEPDGAEAGRGMSAASPPGATSCRTSKRSTRPCAQEARRAGPRPRRWCWPRRRGRGAAFAAGFILTLIVAVVLTATYTMAPRIAEHLPGSARRWPAMFRASMWRGSGWTMPSKAAGALRGLTGETP